MSRVASGPGACQALPSICVSVRGSRFFTRFPFLKYGPASPFGPGHGRDRAGVRGGLDRTVQRRAATAAYVSSIGGRLTMARAPIYAATKLGLHGFCASLRQDLHGSGVSASVVFPGSVRDVGFVADAHLPLAPGSKGISSDAVARSVITAIAHDRGEVDAAELPARIMAKLAGAAPEFTARLVRRKEITAWGDQVADGLRHRR
ncbi:SDR family NAD(P)-dependent oxidoreductase [Nocardia sp. NPDC050799]|uniref:SDR family NAD(P)-dependent oxidoreductase n=1 Tax=Nocardia sp. NPDC050799 TaxID=3154842 RepID=UPI00340F7483